MTPDEVFQLSEILRVGQGREFESTEFDLWERLLAGISFVDADVAVTALLRETDAFITPALVRQRVRQLHSERLEQAHAMPTPGVDPADVAAYLGWSQVWRRGILAGHDSSVATEVADRWAADRGALDGGKVRWRQLDRTLPARSGGVEVQAVSNRVPDVRDG